MSSSEDVTLGWDIIKERTVSMWLRGLVNADDFEEMTLSSLELISFVKHLQDRQGTTFVFDRSWTLWQWDSFECRFEWWLHRNDDWALYYSRLKMNAHCFDVYFYCSWVSSFKLWGSLLACWVFMCFPRWTRMEWNGMLAKMIALSFENLWDSMRVWI